MHNLRHFERLWQAKDCEKAQLASLLSNKSLPWQHAAGSCQATAGANDAFTYSCKSVNLRYLSRPHVKRSDYVSGTLIIHVQLSFSLFEILQWHSLTLCSHFIYVFILEMITCHQLDVPPCICLLTQNLFTCQSFSNLIWYFLGCIKLLYSQWMRALFWSSAKWSQKFRGAHECSTKSLVRSDISM